MLSILIKTNIHLYKYLTKLLKCQYFIFPVTTRITSEVVKLWNNSFVPGMFGSNLSHETKTGFSRNSSYLETKACLSEIYHTMRQKLPSAANYHTMKQNWPLTVNYHTMRHELALDKTCYSCKLSHLEEKNLALPVNYYTMRQKWLYQ